jgi:hypothetical protein
VHLKGIGPVGVPVRVHLAECNQTLHAAYDAREARGMVFKVKKLLIIACS